MDASSSNIPPRNGENLVVQNMTRSRKTMRSALALISFFAPFALAAPADPGNEGNSPHKSPSDKPKKRMVQPIEFESLRVNTQFESDQSHSERKRSRKIDFPQGQTPMTPGTRRRLSVQFSPDKPDTIPSRRFPVTPRERRECLSPGILRKVDMEGTSQKFSFQIVCTKLN